MTCSGSAVTFEQATGRTLEPGLEDRQAVGFEEGRQHEAPREPVEASQVLLRYEPKEANLVAPSASWAIRDSICGHDALVARTSANEWHDQTTTISKIGKRIKQAQVVLVRPGHARIEGKASGSRSAP